MRFLDNLRARLAHPPPEPTTEHRAPSTTLLYWRVYETTDERVTLCLPPTGCVDGYPTRREAVIAARRLSRGASRDGRFERYVVGATVEAVKDPLEGRCWP